MKSKIAYTIVWIAVALIFYKYVITQTELIQPGKWKAWVAIACLIIVSFALGGFETAVTSMDEGAISNWLHETSLRRDDLETALAGSAFNSIPPIRAIASFLYYMKEELVFETFTVKDQASGRRVQRIASSVALMLTMGVIIDVNITVLFSHALADSDIFSINSFSIPHISDNKFWNNILPLPGKDGFTSVGVSMIMLVFIETVPKLIAMKHSKKFIVYANWIVGIVYLIYIPSVLSDGVERIALYVISRVDRLRRLLWR